MPNIRYLVSANLFRGVRNVSSKLKSFPIIRLTLSRKATAVAH